MRITYTTVFNICKTYALAAFACFELNMLDYYELFKDGIFDALRDVRCIKQYPAAQAIANLATMDPNGCMDHILELVDELKDARDAYLDSISIDNLMNGTGSYRELLHDGCMTQPYLMDEFIPLMRSIVRWLDKQNAECDTELYELVEDVFLDAVTDGDAVVFRAADDVMNKAEAIFAETQEEDGGEVIFDIEQFNIEQHDIKRLADEFVKKGWVLDLDELHNNDDEYDEGDKNDECDESDESDESDEE